MLSPAVCIIIAMFAVALAACTGWSVATYHLRRTVNCPPELGLTHWLRTMYARQCTLIPILPPSEHVSPGPPSVTCKPFVMLTHNAVQEFYHQLIMIQRATYRHLNTSLAQEIYLPTSTLITTLADAALLVERADTPIPVPTTPEPPVSPSLGPSQPPLVPPYNTDKALGLFPCPDCGLIMSWEDANHNRQDCLHCNPPPK